MEKILSFLSGLKQNNNREWFESNRERYEESRSKIIFLTDLLINEIRQFDCEVEPQDAKKCIFRLYRDVRFSKNKEPYKTNFGIFISKEGRKSRYSGYYLHIEPNNQSFVGGGVYHPVAQNLSVIRHYLNENIERFYEITNQSEFKSYYPELLNHQLKTAPRDFPKDHPNISLLRYKSFAFSHSLKDEELTQKDFFNQLIKLYKILHPFNQFVNGAFENC